MSSTLTLHEPVEPAFAANINLIVFATDDTYAPYCGVAIASLIANAHTGQNYDIVILEESLSPASKTTLTALAQSKTNISVRFFNVQALIEEYKDLLYVSGHLSSAAYYRFFIVQIFAAYEKALYLDCDIILDGDIAELIRTDLGSHHVAAIQDYIIMQKHAYLADTLGLGNETRYFNSGVMLFNVAALQEGTFLEDCFSLLRERGETRWPDQDMLNILFQGATRFVSLKWNYITDLKAFGSSLEAGLSKEAYATLLRIEQNSNEAPCLIHFAGKKKPWYPLQTFLSERFWQYAALTPFHAELLSKACAGIPEALGKARKKVWGYAILALLTWGNTRKMYMAKKKYYTDSILATKLFAAKHIR